MSGGAYGGFSDFDSHSGMFTYLSYRDPNLLKTVDNYDGEHAHMSKLGRGITQSLCRQIAIWGALETHQSAKTGLHSNDDLASPKSVYTCVEQLPRQRQAVHPAQLHNFW